MEEKLSSQRLSVCHMEIQMRKIQAAQRVPCLNFRIDVRFILTRVCYTFVEFGDSLIPMRQLELDTSEDSPFQRDVRLLAYHALVLDLALHQRGHFFG